MQFERLKKSHKKEIIIGAIVICIVSSALTFATTKAKYKLTESIDLVKGTINYKPYDFKIMAMYKSDDGTNYTEINTMPSEGYIINEEKTYCTTDNKTKVKGKIKTVNGKHYITGLTKSDKCYLYFDKEPSGSEIILADITFKTSTPNFGQTAITDEGVYRVSDGMYGGYSYYWRGAVTNNYVKFAGFCWRIIRINGDGSIRLIYDGSSCHANGTETSESIVAVDQKYNPSNAQSNYVGWTYEETRQRPINNATGTPSNAKAQTDSWFGSNITGANLEKIADGKYCNDRNVASDNTWGLKPEYEFYYAAYNRVAYQHWLSSPTLNCSNEDIYILKVGAITIDEASFAGGLWSTNNKAFYLYNGQNYWTMTPNRWYYFSASFGVSSAADVFLVNNSGNLFANNVDMEYGIRPVINLKANTTFVSGGTGTLDNPYVVQ